MDLRSRARDVVLVTGALPLLAGLPVSLIDHGRRTLRATGVSLLQGVNVARVELRPVHLEDETVLAGDLAVWCGGIEDPPLVQGLPVPHGKGDRNSVDPTLEVPGHPGVFAVGDVAEFKEPRTGSPLRPPPRPQSPRPARSRRT